MIENLDPREIIGRQMAKQNYKNADMRKLTGLSAPTISELRWGKSDMRVSRFRKALRALGCKLLVRTKEGEEYEVSDYKTKK